MGTHIDTENAKILRRSFDYLRITLRDASDNSIIERLYMADIISCILSLRSVDTDPANAELQVSTIEIKIAYDSITERYFDLDSLRSKRIAICYDAGYTDDRVQRVFYMNPEDGIDISNSILTINGSDCTRFIEGEDTGRYIATAGSWTPGAENYYSYMLKGAYDVINRANRGSIQYSGTTPGSAGAALMERKSFRKNIAILANAFRGSNPSNPTAKRFIYRDAGMTDSTGMKPRPQAIWANDALSGTDVYELDYNNLSDVKFEYAPAIAEIRYDNPRVTDNTGTFIQIGELDCVTDERHLYTTEDPCTVLYVAPEGVSPNTPEVLRHAIVGMSPWAFDVKDWFTGKGIVWAFVIKSLYPGSGETDTVISTAYTEGRVVEMEPVKGVRTSSGNGPFYYAYTAGLTDCGLAMPKWINFKWRGNPFMNPRDFILLTEKDRTRSYYEIDSLTIEHVDGGCVSQVRAIYKMPYTEA